MTTSMYVVYFRYNTPDEDEIRMKGFRTDVYVRVEDFFFQVAIFDPVRLLQSFEGTVERRECFETDPGLILVPEVTNSEIFKAVGSHVRAGFFKALKPLDPDEVAKLYLTQVYPPLEVGKGGAAV